MEKVNKNMREVTQQLSQVNHDGDSVRLETENHRRATNSKWWLENQILPRLDFLII